MLSIEKLSNDVGPAVSGKLMSWSGNSINLD
jgi:hypothetical protein